MDIVAQWRGIGIAHGVWKAGTLARVGALAARIGVGIAILGAAEADGLDGALVRVDIVAVGERDGLAIEGIARNHSESRWEGNNIVVRCLEEVVGFDVV